MTTARILIVDDDLFSRKLISATLVKGGYACTAVSSGAEALSYVAQETPDLIILDVMMPEMDGYELCAKLREMPQTARIPIIMLTGQDSLEEKVKGFEVGADDYITKPFQPMELLARVSVLLKRTSLYTSEQGTINSKVIAVFSLRGGVGVTSVAANLAIALSEIWGKPTVLADFVFTSGQDALMLNVPMRNTWADIGNIPPEEITNDIVEKLLLPHASGVRVLAAPKHPSDGDLITQEKITNVLSFLKTNYHYVVLDLAHNFNDQTLAALDLADEILVLLAPEMASVRATATTIDVFETLGYSRNQVRLVINWLFERRGLARRDIETVLKRPINMVIPFAPETFVSAINLGAPIVYEDASSPIAALFEDFAFYLSKDEHRKQKPKEPTDAWIRIAKRFQQRKRK